MGKKAANPRKRAIVAQLGRIFQHQLLHHFRPNFSRMSTWRNIDAKAAEQMRKKNIKKRGIGCSGN